ncbi:MAG: InlB B-repeat-containing protein, partial [Planctomycetota bacterium]
MKGNRLNTSGAAAIVLLVVLITPLCSLAEMVNMDLPFLADRCEHAVTGTVQSVESAWNSQHTRILTTVEIRVKRDFKGNVSADRAVLTLTELGGTVGETTMVVQHTPFFVVGEEVLVFTEKTPDGRLIVLGRTQGKVTLANSRNQAMRAASPGTVAYNRGSDDTAARVWRLMVDRGYTPVMIRAGDQAADGGAISPSVPTAALGADGVTPGKRVRPHVRRDEVPEDPPSSGGGGRDSGDCCYDHCSQGPGCEDFVCEFAVCYIDTFCCTDCWDEVCAARAYAEPNCDCGGGGPYCCDPPYSPGDRVRDVYDDSLGTVVCCDYDDPFYPILVTWDGETGGGGQEQCQWCDGSYTCNFPSGSAFWSPCGDIAPSVCGDGVCDPLNGENASTCPQDCSGQGCVPDFTVTAPHTSPMRSTCGEGDDCGLWSSEEHIYEVTIPSAGYWRFSLCSSSWDTYLYLGTTCCGNQVGEDDDGCGEMYGPSELLTNLNAGTYYVAIEGYSVTDCGNYVLSIEPAATPPVISAVVPNHAPAGLCDSGSAENLITITGSNFGTQGADDHVLFFWFSDGVVDTYVYDDNCIVSWSDSQIQCYVAPQASSRDLTVYKSGSWSNFETFWVDWSYWSRWEGQAVMPIEYYINQSGTPDVPGTGEFDAVHAALQTWEEIACCYVGYDYMGTTTRQAGDFDGYNVVSWTESGWDHGTGVIGVSLIWISLPAPGFILETDLELNSEDFLFTTDDCGASSPDLVDVQSLVTHEAGHGFVGLGDLYGPPDQPKTMYGIMDVVNVECYKRDLAPEDAAGARWIYLPPVSDLTLQVTPSGGGTTSPAAGTHSYDCGQVVSVSAYPAECYEFDHWNGPVADPNSPNTTVEVDGEITVEAVFSPAGAGLACGDPADTTCDDPDTCDGAGTCLDNFESPITLCRGALGDCDVAEFCPGDGPNCPPDEFAPPATPCGNQTPEGACDDPDACDGAGICLPNYRAATTECRVSAGACDAAEYCPGDSPACPSDELEPATTVCREPAGGCDAAEFCTGDEPDCPPDELEPPTIVCR